MSNASLLFITFTVPILIIIVVQIILYRKRKKDPLIYDDLWTSFLKNKDSTNYELIHKLGEDIVFNTAINRDHLQVVFQVAKDLESKYSKFNNLKYEAYKRIPIDKKPKFGGL